jgi:uncharacterized membrane protein YoaK (UPF0700 family)
MTSDASRGERPGLADLGLALMALAAGSTDATAFLKLGMVFTSAMTGNTVLLCIAIGQGKLSAALQSFAAFVSFVVGASLAALLCCRRRPPPDRTPPSLVPLFVLEIACLAAFVAVWFALERTRDGTTYGLIALSALAMGVQGVTARQINVPQVNTIVFTTTIISVVVSLVHGLVRTPAPGAVRDPAADRDSAGICDRRRLRRAFDSSRGRHLRLDSADRGDRRVCVLPGPLALHGAAGVTVALPARNDGRRQALNLWHYPELAPWRRVPCGRAI